jgi:superfamily II DNA or RNA helicase
VASKHKSAPWFLKQGFFEGIKSFKEFEARTGKLADTVEMGDALEILVEAYLHLDKVLNAKDVWVVGSIPLDIRKALNLPNDSKGIDGVYEDQAGNYIPYQVKYRTNMVTLPFGEISEFLGITEKSLQDRLIFTNCRKLAVDVANRTGVRSVRADKFNELTEADFKRIHAWLTDKKVEPFKPWDPLPHQREAIEKITAGLKEADRTTAVMACGTGKTLVALWAAEAQQPKTVLVLVPSLALLSQTLPDWCKQTSWGERFRYICVCSDDSVNREAQQDGYTYKQEDLEFSVTTDAKEVKKFLGKNKDGVNVIFSTYQSAEVVAEGLKGQTVDLGIFDEAHKTTGDKEGLFAFGLSDKNIRIKKRLFLTATPRHYKLSNRDKDGDFKVVSMSDETVYGKVSYRLPFSTAVAAGIIVPYKVIISVSLNKEVDAELLRRGSTRVRRDDIQAKWVANQIALKRAIEKTGASKVITFHSRVNLAEDFAGDDARGFKEHVKGFDVFHVNGSQNAADRKALLEGFKAAPKGLITNARCLTEGVDVPAVDMVAFVDPRKSKIDIAQAAGRAMRQSKATNKKLGYIVVPLFIEQKKGETEAEAFTRAGFDEVAEVLGAMLESDDDLVDTIEKMQEARGRGDKFNPRQLHEKIEVIGPAINLDKLTHSIDVEILERLGLTWDMYYGSLRIYHKKEGHCRVSQQYESKGLKLGLWVSNQRQRKELLEPDQINRLDALGFSWDPQAEQWELGFAALCDFKKREGHCRVSERQKLGQWVKRQRQRKSQLTQEQMLRLNKLGFSWDPHAEQWEEAFEELKRIKQRKGHCRIAQNLRVNGIGLGIWVNAQRQARDHLSQDRIEKLNSIGFSWDPLSEQWEECFTALREFRNREGHCRVHPKFKRNGLRLGAWVLNLRSRKNRLLPEQIKRLDSLDFSWDPVSEQWEEAFAALKKFCEREGHCRVPQSLFVDNLKLGSWVSRQRNPKQQLTPERIKRLKAIGFSWDPHSEQWEKAYEALKKFHKSKGHCLVTQTTIVDGFKLGVWVILQRQKKNRLSKMQVKRLDSLGFSWDPVSEKWEELFAILKKFREREGHCRVNQKMEIDGVKIGSWVTAQRQKKAQLSPSQISRLNSLGYSWDPKDEQWEEFFAALENFVRSNGHCRITQTMKVGGLKVGIWAVNQRARKERLTPTQISRLNSIGFSWDPLTEQWEAALSALKRFRLREGHCRVPQRHVEEGVRLGSWVNTQRQKKDSLSAERTKRLNSEGFIWKA